MHDHDHPTDMNRRRFGLLALAGAAAGVAPGAARAAAPCIPPTIHLPALAGACMDYRLPDNYIGFFNGHIGREKYDLISLAGASLACGSTGMFAQRGGGVFPQLGAVAHI